MKDNAKVYNKIYSGSRLENSLFVLLNGSIADAKIIISEMHSNYLKILSEVTDDPEILSYVYGSVSKIKIDSMDDTKFGCIINRPDKIPDGSKYLSNPLAVILADILCKSLYILWFLSDHEKCRYDVSNDNYSDFVTIVKSFESDILLANSLIAKALSRKLNSSLGGKNKTNKEGIIEAICDYLRENGNRSSKEIWKYFKKYDGVDVDSGYINLIKYDIFVDSEENVCQKKHVNKNGTDVVILEKISKITFINKYIKLAKSKHSD